MAAIDALEALVGAIARNRTISPVLSEAYQAAREALREAGREPAHPPTPDFHTEYAEAIVLAANDDATLEAAVRCHALVSFTATAALGSTARQQLLENAVALLERAAREGQLMPHDHPAATIAIRAETLESEPEVPRCPNCGARHFSTSEVLSGADDVAYDRESGNLVVLDRGTEVFMESAETRHDHAGRTIVFCRQCDHEWPIRRRFV